MGYNKLDINIEKLCEEYLREEEDCYTLAKKYGCAHSTIHRKLKQSGNQTVLNTLERIVDLNKEEVLKEYLNGVSTNQLAKKFKVASSRISEVIRKSNNQHALEKLILNTRTNAPSEIVETTDISFGVIANNTKNIFYFPIWTLDAFIGKAWNENKFGHLAGKIGGKQTNAHSIVLGCALKGLVVDHINGDTKNNMPHNLRIVSRCINSHNQKLRNTNRSGYAGVCFDKSKNKWVAQISVGMKHFYLGRYETKEEAAFTYLETKYNLFGFEVMRTHEVESYNDLLLYFARKEDVA